MTESDGQRRHATIRTRHGTADGARAVARSLTPDNTAEMETRVEGEMVVTTIERPTTGGLHSNVDDYVVNLDVAAQLANQPTDNTHDI